MTATPSSSPCFAYLLFLLSLERDSNARNFPSSAIRFESVPKGRNGGIRLTANKRRKVLNSTQFVVCVETTLLATTIQDA